MQVSTFQALCLLPNGEQFVAFRQYWAPVGKKARWNRWMMSLAEVSKLAAATDTSRLCKRDGIGYVLSFGSIYLKLDRTKMVAYLKANGLQIIPRKEQTGDSL